MNNCEHNKPSEEKVVSSPSCLQAWGRRMALLATLVGGGMLMESCATAQGNRPDSMSADENDPEASLLRQFGTAEEGKQPDGSYIKVSTSKKKSSAIKKAKKFIRIRLKAEKEDDISFDTKFSPSPLAGGKWMVCVKGKLAEVDLEEQLLSEFDAEKEGNQDDGSYIKVSTSKKKRSAEKKAKKFIRIRLKAKKGDDISFDTKFSTSQLPDGKWIAVVRGEFAEAALARGKEKEEIEKEFWMDAEQFAKKMADVEKFGIQDDDSIVLHGVSKTAEEVEKMSAQLEGMANKLASKLKLTFNYTFQTEQMKDGSERWVTILRSDEGIPEPIKPEKEVEIEDEEEVDLDKIREQLQDEIDRMDGKPKKSPEVIEGEVEEAQLLQREEKSVEDYLKLLKGRNNPLRKSELDTPINRHLLAQTFLKKGYPAGTQIIIQKMKQGDKHLFVFTLNGRPQGIGKGKNLKEAFESALQTIEPNELDDKRSEECKKRLKETRRIKIPKDITPTLAREWLARMFLDKEFPKGTDVEVEIDSRLNKAEDGLLFTVNLTINGKRYGKGEGMGGNLAFQDALEQVETNDMTPEGLEKYKEMLKKLKKFKMPKELRKPIYKKWLARTLADSGYEFDPDMTITVEKETDNDPVLFHITMVIPEFMSIETREKSAHEAFASMTDKRCAENVEEVRAYQEGGLIVTVAKPETKPLSVNTNSKHEVIAKSRQVGEVDLINLANQEGVGDIWLYVRNYNGEERFHECGEDETREKTSFDMGVLDEVIPKNKIGQVTLYKQHPVDRDGKLDKSQMVNEQGLKGFLHVLELVKDRNPKLVEQMDLRIAVSSGIYRIKFHPQILKNEKLMALLIHRIHELHEVWLKPYHHDFNYEQRERSNFPKTNTEFAKRFSSRLMEIEFEPTK